MFMKRLLCTCLVLSMCLGLCLALASCGEEPGPDVPPVDQNNYHVTVVDFQGKGVNGVIVEITTADGPIMRVTDADGKAGFDLPDGTYTFTIMSPTTQYQYDAAACQLSSEKKDATVVVYNKPTGGSQQISAVPYGTEQDEGSLFGPERKDYTAYYVKGGATWVPLTPGDISYFIYTAEAAGTYRFAVTGAEDVSVGYYGVPSFVQQNSLVEAVDGTIEIEIREANLAQGEGVATVYVIGVYSPSATSGVLNITRKGDNVYIPEVDEPWISYTAPESEIREYIVHDINDTVAPLTNIDVTDPSFKVVYSETDGYYHVGTADGPVVMMHLTSASPYLAPLSDVAGTALIGKIFYDENGTFVKKEAYNELFLQYIGKEDINGCVPLDKYLAHALQNRGEYCGWWDEDKMMYLFGDIAIYKPNAWLFACGYYGTIEENTSGTEETPAHITLSHVNYGKGYVTLTPNEVMYIQADLNMKVTLQVGENNCAVFYNRVTYPISNGKVVVEIDTAIGSVFTVYFEGDAPVRITFLVED